MAEAQNILVGVDLSHGDHLISADLLPATTAVTDQAIELASKTGGKLTFFAAIDLPPHTLEYLEEEDPNALQELGAKADRVLQLLVAKAQEKGVTQAAGLHVIGKSWFEIVKQVLRGHHDLVMAGTRNQSDLKRMFFGSTSLKLLRNCPCPVWVSKPFVGSKTRKILVADDLTEVGARLVRLGATVAAAEGAELHILHSLETPWDPTLKHQDPKQEAFHQKRCRQAATILAAHSDCSEVKQLIQPPEIHLREDLAENAILHAILNDQYDLLVMATIARSGLAGFLMGNTAERLLPQVTCSVLAVKPEDFKCPVSLDDSST